MEMTRERISRILELREMLHSFQTGFNLVSAAVVCAILDSISGLESSSDTFELRYLKLVTISSFWPFTLISLLMPLVLSSTWSSRLWSPWAYYKQRKVERKSWTGTTKHVPHPPSKTAVNALSWICRSQGKWSSRWTVSKVLKCWGAWDTTCGDKAKGITPSLAWRWEGVQWGGAHLPTFTGRGRVIVGQTTVGIISKAAMGKHLRDGQRACGRSRACI